MMSSAESSKKLVLAAKRLRWCLISVPIYVKVFGIGLFISLLFAAVAYQVMRSSVLESHYQTRGEMALSLAVSLASRLESQDLSEKTSLDLDLHEMMAIFPSVRYIMVQDSDERILSHGLTFPREAPPDLALRGEALCASCHTGLSPEELPMQLLESSSRVTLPEGRLRAYRRPEGLILEVTAPIGDGGQGSVRVGVADKQISDSLTVVNHSILAGIALCLVATLCSAMLLTYVLNKPIRSLLKATKVVSGGNFEARAPVYSDDELGRLAVAFNKMAENLAESRQRILRADKLASIGEFAAGVAHEINNPLDGVLSCLERLQREPANLSQNMEYLQMIKHALNRIASVIQRLLEYSQQREIHLQPEDIGKVIENVVALIRVMACQKEVAIEIDSPLDVPRVACDRYYLEQALLNLAINGLAAIEEATDGKATAAPRGTLTFCTAPVTAPNGAEHVRIDVTDTGTGIKRENMERIFDPFFTTKEAGKGTGLGLAIVKVIVEAHAGRIEVESVVGQGTTFHMYLPASTAQAEMVSNKERAAG